MCGLGGIEFLDWGWWLAYWVLVSVTGKYNDVMQPAKRESALRAQGGGPAGAGGPLGPPGGPGGPSEACQNPASGLAEPCQWPARTLPVAPASSWPVRRRASRARSSIPDRNLAPGTKSGPRGPKVGAGVKLAGPPARFARHGRQCLIGNKPWPLGTSVIQICDRFSTFVGEQ